ncbi:MAG: penicillin-binding protein 1B [Pseudomonadales bacterium]|nr:penicillin-binding protein 1B [Pseudomonadales bacterium]
MAKRRTILSARRATKRPAKRGQKKPRSWAFGLLKLTFGFGLFVALGVLGYLIFLDRSITSTFEGRRWSVPAQVFAQPLELHAGAQISRWALTRELSRLGYSNDANLTTPGTFKTQNSELQIFLRPFQFMERARGAQRISVHFADTHIQRITNGNGEVPLIRLEPAIIGSFFPSHGEDRLILTPDQVPSLLSEGLKSIEDRNFDTHIGFSATGILRAFWVNLSSGERQQGGSTLTQQLVKSYFLDNRRTIERKLKEVAMAIILDARFSKEDLLTAYINEIFLGQHGNRAVHGFGLGAQFYFNKPLAELKADEIATLISVIRGPSYYNPFRHPQRARERRNRILNTFARDGLISGQTLATSLAQPLGVVDGPSSGGAYYPAFMDMVRSDLRDFYAQSDLNSKGLRVFTTLKPREQENTQQAVSHVLGQIELDRRLTAKSLQAAAIVADTQTGDIQALVGGRQGRIDGFNRALNAERPVGSLIKPVVYLTAIENGMSLADPVKDEPITLTPKFGEPWSPKNFDGQFYGELPLFRALAQSRNLATVQLGMSIGLEQIQTRLSNLTTRAPKNPYPSLLLGAEPLSPLKMLELYGNFASGGFRTHPKAVIAVLDPEGQPVSHHPFELEQTIAPNDAATLARALEIVMAKGTGRSSPYAQAGVAGKTGTSNDNRDSWFAGFDNSRLTVVWVGRDDNEPTGLTGGSGALRVWNEITHGHTIDPLIHVHADELLEVEFQTGLRAHKDCADVVLIPVPSPQNLAIKPGCNIGPSMRQRVKGWFD